VLTLKHIDLNSHADRDLNTKRTSCHSDVTLSFRVYRRIFYVNCVLGRFVYVNNKDMTDNTVYIGVSHYTSNFRP